MALDLDVLSSFVHLTENLDSFALDLGKRALFDFGLLKTDLLSSVSVLFLVVLFSLDESALKKVQALVLKALDIVFALVPLADLLIFHQAAS